MTTFNSIGDQARSYQLRLSQYLLKSKLNGLTKEVATGIKNDIPKAMNGDLSRITHIQSRLTALATYQNNASEAQSMFHGMQTALEGIQNTVNGIGPSILSEANASPEDILRMRASQISQDFRAIFGTLNTSIGGRFVFSGSKTDTAPMGSFDDMLAGLNSAISGSTTASEIVEKIDTWFDAPAGAGGFIDTTYQGSDTGNTEITISADRKVGSDLTASSSELREMLKGMAIISYAANASTPVDSATLRDLFTVSGLRLIDASTGLTTARSMVGLQEEAVAQTQASNTAEATSLSLARSALISADPYETATALQETEASIQNLYTLTARLSRLRLTDYLS